MSNETVETNEKTETKTTKLPKGKGKEKTEEKVAPVVPLTNEEKLKAEVKAAIAAVESRYEFIPDRKSEHGQVPVGDLVVIEGFDSRAAHGAVDAQFMETLKRADGTPHLIEPVIAAWAKDKTTGKIVRVLVAGRRRLSGFITLGFATIECVTKSMAFQEALVDTGIENMKRAGLSAWDKAIFFQRLVASGLSQKEVAVKLSISNSNVSQSLSILTLDERVVKIAKAGRFGPGGDTICRELAKIEDPDVQAQVAAEVIADPEHIWAASDVERYVKELNDKEDARQKKKAEREKEKKRLAKEAKARGETGEAEEAEEEEEEEETSYYDIESFELREVTPLHLLMEKTHTDMQKIADKHEKLKANVAEIKSKYGPEVLKYVESQGLLKGLEMAVGVKDLPAAVLKAAAASEAASE